MRISLFIYWIGLLSQGNTQNQTTEIHDMEPREKTQDPTALGDIFISVKTTYKNHKTRLRIILRTWYQLAMHQTWFFTDRDDNVLQTYTRGHIVNTHCPSSHEIFDLCCKTNAEFDAYIQSDKKWFCRFDDDVFVNVPTLLDFLQRYDYTEDWYFGKNCCLPVAINVYMVQNKALMEVPTSFSYATGFGYCISKSLANKMAPYARLGRFINICLQTQYPEDVAIGYLIGAILKVNLTAVTEFHSHLEYMRELDPSTFVDQITLGYLLPGNVITVPGPRIQGDLTGFLSLFEYLYKLKPKDANDIGKEEKEQPLTPSTRKRFVGRKMLHGKYKLN